MKLLMISSEFPPDRQSGTSVSFAELYGQARQHCNVRLMSGWSRARSLIPPEAIAIDFSNLSKIQRNIVFLQSIQREVRQWKPDVILSNGFLSYVGKTPSMVLMHGSKIYRKTEKFATLKNAIQSRILAKKDKLICNNEKQSQYLHNAGIPLSKIEILPLGIDVNHHHMAPLPKERPFRIVCPVRIVPEKKIERIIDAIAKLRKKDKSQVELHIVGSILNHVYADKLRIQAYGQPIFFHPDVKDMRHYIINSHLVLYLHHENSYIHRTAMEAMAMGRTVLWFGNSSIPSAMSRHGITCSGTSDHLKTTITTIINDPNRLAQLANSGRDLMEKEYNWNILWHQYNDLFRDLITNEIAP